MSIEVLKLFFKTPYTFWSESRKSSPPSIAFKEIVWQLASILLKKFLLQLLKKSLKEEEILILNLVIVQSPMRRAMPLWILEGYGSFDGKKKSRWIQNSFKWLAAVLEFFPVSPLAHAKIARY